MALSINIPSPVKLGPGFWKLNLSILTDPEYIGCIHNFWSGWRLQKLLYNNLLLWWDLAKQWIRTLPIRFCSLLNRSKRSERSNLEKLISNLKIQIDAGNSSVIPQYKRLLDQLAKLDAHQAEGLRVRSRVQWAEEGESSSAFFFKTIKKRQSDNTIFVVKNNSDQYVSSTPDLLNAWQEFYVNLFTAVPTDEDLQNILLRQLESRLDSDLSDLCEGPLTLEECFNALKGISHGKTPGLDGLPIGVLLCFLGHPWS